jgi:DNA-binding response OmpR family regulator
MSIKVLYVEDELFLGKIVKETLESRGFEVAMETDGATVMTTFHKEQPDVCVLDVMLPHRNGFELAEDIRNENDDIPIIFLTAKTQTEDVIKGFRTGGNDYIRKPFSMEELIVRIENVLRVKKDATVIPITTDTLAVGKYIFNLNRQVLAGNGEEKKLSYRESELLKYLWQNRNSIIERKDMLNCYMGK